MLIGNVTKSSYNIFLFKIRQSVLCSMKASYLVYKVEKHKQCNIQ